MTFKEGDRVKIAIPFKGFGAYGLRKGSIGYIIKKSIFRGENAYQVDFPISGKEISMFPRELEMAS